MEDYFSAPIDDAKARRAFRAILRELLRYRKSLVYLYSVVRKQRRKLQELERKISSFIEPS